MFKKKFHLMVLAVLLAPSSLANSAAEGRLVPPQELAGPVTPATAGDLLYYESSHSLSVGDKGEESFDLSIAPPACGERALVFEKASIVYKKRRFGEAKIVQQPLPGCLQCSPLVVRWYHEPTGFVDFQVHIYRRERLGVCES